MFRQRLDELVNLKHPLAQLASHIDWGVFEREWAGHFPSSRGRPATSTRLIAGQLYLQHTFALFDEDVVWGRVENPYWVRRETGKAQVVKVHCDEGVANHIGPEPYVAIAAARQCVSALRLRPLGGTVASTRSQRQGHHRQVCR